MTRRQPAPGIGRKLAYGYAAWGIALLIVLAMRATDLQAWFWRSLLIALGLTVSLRSALVYAYREKPSRLNWWLRPTRGVENNFAVTWLVYAVIFSAFPLLVLFL